MNWKEALAIVPAAMVVGGGLIAYGRFSDRLDQQDRRIAALERSAGPGTHLADICLQLIQQESSSRSKQQIADQMDRFGCYDRVPADTTLDVNLTGTVADGANVTTNAMTAVQN